MKRLASALNSSPQPPAFLTPPLGCLKGTLNSLCSKQGISQYLPPRTYFISLPSESLPRDVLVVQWLRLCTSNAGGVGSIPSWGTEIPYAAQYGQKLNKKKACLSPSSGGNQKTSPDSNLLLLHPASKPGSTSC